MDLTIIAHGPGQLSWGPTTLGAPPWESLIRAVGGPWMPWVPGHGSRKWSLVVTLQTCHYTEKGRGDTWGSPEGPSTEPQELVQPRVALGI